MRTHYLALGLLVALGLSFHAVAESLDDAAAKEATPAPVNEAGAAGDATPPVETEPAEDPAEPAAPPSAAEPAPGDQGTPEEDHPAAPDEAMLQADEEPLEGSAADAVPSEDGPASVPASSEAASADDATLRTELGPVGYDEQGRAGRVHVVVRGDTLWDIANAYLGTPWVWPSIWRANDDIQNPHLILPGDRLWISQHEMRRISESEAARLLAGQPASRDEAASFDEGASPLQEAPVEGPRFYFSFLPQTGILSASALAASSSLLDSTVDRTWLGSMDPVWIGLGAGQVTEGDRFKIFRVTEEVLDPDTGRVFGVFVNVLGWLEVKEVHPESSVAMIRHAHSEIRKGDRILPLDVLPQDIAIHAGPAGIEGRLTYFPASRTQMGGEDVVYLNRGSMHGLSVGNPLEVFRSSAPKLDVEHGERRAVSDHVVAKLLVVATEPESAVAVVTHSMTELEHAERFRSASSVAP